MIAGSCIFKCNASNPAIRVASRPGVMEFKPQVMAYFLKNQAIAGHIFEEVSFNIRVLSLGRSEGFPEQGLSVFHFHPDQSQGAGVVMTLVELVHRAIGKKAAVGVNSTGSESATRGDEHPQIGVAGNAHQKGVHAIECGDAVMDLSIQFHEPAGGQGC